MHWMDMDEQRYKNGLAQGRKDAINEILSRIDGLMKNLSPHSDYDWGRRSAFTDTIDMIFKLMGEHQNGEN